MRRRRRIITTAITLVLLQVLYMVFVESQNPRSTPGLQIVSVAITTLLAFCLVLGKNWARWVLVVLVCGQVTLRCVFLTAIVFVSDTTAHEGTMARLWFPIMAVCHAAVGIFLASSSGVSREIERASRWSFQS